MSPDKAPPPPMRPSTRQESAPQVFDADQRRLRRLRAGKRVQKQAATSGASPAGFFVTRCAEDAAERLQDIAKTFERALIIGPADFWPALKTRLPDAKHPKSITTAYDSLAGDFDIIAPDDNLPVDGPTYDLIISCLSLHSVNDLPGALLNMRHILDPDGLMMASLFGGDSLRELRAHFYTVEAAQLGGVSLRIFPMIDFSQAASLLQRTGYALPVVDTDRFTVNYSALSTLISDLRDAGETNVTFARNKAPLSRSFFAALEAQYRDTNSTEAGKLIASFEILWMTGWAPHERQQKPLKPGSAKMRLSDALGAKEIKL